METKKKRPATVSNQQQGNVKKVTQFFTDVKTECKKITWTNREELFTYAKIVIAATFVFGFTIFFMDLCIQGVLDLLRLAFRGIFG